MSSIYQISPELHAPYIMQSAFSAGAAGHKDRQRYAYLSEFPRRAPTSVDRHERPAAGHTDYPYPSGLPNPAIFQYSSDGVFRQNQLIAQFQHPRRREAFSVRLLLSELRQ